MPYLLNLVYLLVITAALASRVADTTAEPVRYDAARQVTQVRVDGDWVDARKAPRRAGMTRVTKVQNETTDDEHARSRGIYHASG